MDIIIHHAPQTITGKIELPASKSISNRALIINALNGSNNPIKNLAHCDDTDVLLKSLNSKDNHFDIGAAGTAMRFLTAYLANKPGNWHITGSERMKQRPIGILVEALKTLGAEITYPEREGFPPLSIKGKAIEGGDLQLDGSVSSQFISALLMIAPTMKKGLNLHLQGKLVSQPYIRMTLEMLRQYGVESVWEGNNISIAPQTIEPTIYNVESDWSAASYWYAIAALSNNCKIQLPHLYENSLQGDSQLARIYSNLGVKTEFKGGGVILSQSEKNSSQFTYNFESEPDIAQTVVVTCCALNKPFRFRGLQTLKIKETNRIEALINECKKIGFLLYEPCEGELAWNGERCPKDSLPEIDTYKDHRMAMAFAPASLVLGPLKIKDAGVVSKSYPLFWEDLKSVGFELQQVD